jgi:hypothetical protein
MRISRKFICLGLGWAVLLVAGLYLTGGLSPAPGAVVKAKQDRQVALARSKYVRCLTLSYATGHRSSASQSEVTGACASEAEPVRATFIRAGFLAPHAQKEIEALAEATYREMLILIPPCPEDKSPSLMS